MENLLWFKIRSKRSNPSCTYNIEFDARKQWPQCADIINIIKNQGQCGDCWAVASSSTFTDRYCIERAKKGLKTPVSDPDNQSSDDEILSCTPSTSGCNGGSPYYAWQYMQNSGVVSGSNFEQKTGCKPYSIDPATPGPNPKPQCVSTFISTGQIWPDMAVSEAVNTMKAEIQASGPITGIMDVYDDFFHYGEGVYKRTTDKKVSGHGIRIIGWGTQTCSGKVQPFWIAINSWGKEWGMNGVFMIAQGSDECKIETLGAFFGTPKV
uniref:Peptidase C1A papain C-terminal domain-containing protein n=1 Tax=Meloidogyne javanica TaxID=6303 RepID=A0A915LR22_MELJA